MKRILLSAVCLGWCVGTRAQESDVFHLKTKKDTTEKTPRLIVTGNVPVALVRITESHLVLEPFAGKPSNTGEARFRELLSNGNQFVGFKAPDAIGNNAIWTLPNADGTNGQALVTNGVGILSWGSVNAATAASVSFGGIASGTNTTAAMTVGSGASLVPSGTGTITATGLANTLSVMSGGTGTSTPFTPGSVVFAGTGGVYSQNSLLFWDNANARLGVGVLGPPATWPSSTAKLVVQSDVASSPGIYAIGVAGNSLHEAIKIENGNTPGGGGIGQAVGMSFDLRKVIGGVEHAQTAARIAAGKDADWVAADESETDGNLQLHTVQDGLLGERMRITSIGNVGIGTSAPGNKLGVHGSDAAIAIGDITGAGASPSGLQFTDHQTKNVGFRFDGATLIYEDASASSLPSTWYNNTHADFVVRNGNLRVSREGTSSPLNIGADPASEPIAIFNYGNPPVGSPRDGHITIVGTSVPSTDSIGFVSRGDPGAGFSFANRNTDNTHSIKMVITGAGRVGIGTVSPSASLHVLSDNSTNNETGIMIGIPGVGDRRIRVGPAGSGPGGTGRALYVFD